MANVSQVHSHFWNYSAWFEQRCFLDGTYRRQQTRRLLAHFEFRRHICAPFSCGLNQILHLYSGAGKVMSVLCPDLLHQTFAFSHERRETSGKGQGCRACVKTAWQSGKRTLKQISSVRTMRQKIRKISANIHSS